MVAGLLPRDNDLEGVRAEALVAEEAPHCFAALMGLLFVDMLSFITLS